MTVLQQTLSARILLAAYRRRLALPVITDGERERMLGRQLGDLDKIVPLLIASHSMTLLYRAVVILSFLVAALMWAFARYRLSRRAHA
jgi:hypothetical protein